MSGKSIGLAGVAAWPLGSRMVWSSLLHKWQNYNCYLKIYGRGYFALKSWWEWYKLNIVLTIVAGFPFWGLRERKREVFFLKEFQSVEGFLSDASIETSDPYFFMVKIYLPQLKKLTLYVAALRFMMWQNKRNTLENR